MGRRRSRGRSHRLPAIVPTRRGDAESAGACRTSPEASLPRACGDWRSTVLSQINAGHAGSVEEAEWKLRQALLDLVGGLRLAGITDYRLVTYESLESEEVRLELARFLEVPAPERFARFPFKNENLKHYAPEAS